VVWHNYNAVKVPVVTSKYFKQWFNIFVSFIEENSFGQMEAKFQWI